MNTDSANAFIVTSLAVSGALVIVKDAATSTMPLARTWVGLTFAGVGLAVLAEVQPQLAGGMAGLILVSAVFVYGGPAWSAIASATGGKSTTGKGKVLA